MNYSYHPQKKISENWYIVRGTFDENSSTQHDKSRKFVSLSDLLLKFDLIWRVRCVEQTERRWNLSPLFSDNFHTLFETMINYEKVKASHGKENTFNHWPKANLKFCPVLSNHLCKAQHTVAMEQFFDKDVNFKILKKMTDNAIKSNKCSQCDFASSQTGNLRTHAKTHSGEKPNKCNHCDYASSQASIIFALIRPPRYTTIP